MKHYDDMTEKEIRAHLEAIAAEQAALHEALRHKRAEAESQERVRAAENIGVQMRYSRTTVRMGYFEEATFVVFGD